MKRGGEGGTGPLDDDDLKRHTGVRAHTFVLDSMIYAIWYTTNEHQQLLFLQTLPHAVESPILSMETKIWLLLLFISSIHSC